jgi:hypothetical protein
MTVSNIHGLILTIYKKDSFPAPSYHWVYKQIKVQSTYLLIIAQKGSYTYKQPFKLLFRHDNDTSNAIWQANHTFWIFGF